MTLMALVAAGHQGLLIRTVGGAIGVDEPVARAALERLLRALAQRMRARAADPIEQQILLDVVARGGFQRYLRQPRVLLGREAIRDGEEVLTYLYGSVEEARDHALAIGPPAGLDPGVFARLMTLTACLLLGAMASRLDQQAHDERAGSGPLGAVLGLGQAIVGGLADGTARALFRRQPGFRRYMKASRRRSAHHPRPARLSLDELLGDLVEEEGKAEN